MPIKRKTTKKTSTKASQLSSITKQAREQNTSKCSCFTSSFGKKLVLTLLAVLIVYLIFFFGTLINNNLIKSEFIGLADSTEKTILVTGYGKVTGSNDIAVMTIGYSNEDKDVSIAQSKNKTVMDKVLKDLEDMNILDADITSDYYIFPQYVTTDDEKKFTGYQVTHQLLVKIRDLTNIQKVLSLSTKHGINKVSGIKFSIDDKENLKNKARLSALDDANRKAMVIANKLGVKIVKVAGYNEYEVNPYGYYAADSTSVGTGSNTMELSVNVTYIIK